MAHSRMLVSLMPAIRKFYQELADEAGVLLRTLQGDAVELFLASRREQSKKAQPVQYLAAPKSAELVNVFLPEKIYQQAMIAADQDRVSLRQLVHTALMSGVDELRQNRRK